MKEDRQKHLEMKVDKLSEQLSSMIESSKNMEDSFRKRIEQVEHEVLDLPEDYDDIEEEDNLQGMFDFKNNNLYCDFCCYTASWQLKPNYFKY